MWLRRCRKQKVSEENAKEFSPPLPLLRRAKGASRLLLGLTLLRQFHHLLGLF